MKNGLSRLLAGKASRGTAADEETRRRGAKASAAQDGEPDDDEEDMPAAEDESAADPDNDPEDEPDEDGDEGTPGGKASRKAAQRIASQAERKERARAREINDLCTLTGKPELAGAFIAEGVATADVRKALLKQKASASKAREIAGQNGPGRAQRTQIDTAAIYAKFNHREQKGSRR